MQYVQVSTGDLLYTQEVFYEKTNFAVKLVDGETDYYDLAICTWYENYYYNYCYSEIIDLTFVLWLCAKGYFTSCEWKTYDID